MKPLQTLSKISLIVVLALGAHTWGLQAAEPNWHYPEFQKPLVDWLKQIKPEDIAIEVVPIELPTLTDGEARRYYPAAMGKHALLEIVAKQLTTPVEAFLWEGGIWREDLPLIQPALTDESHQLKSGQIWVPGHPNTSNVLAWIYNLDEPWNPYYKNQAVAKRAAIISFVSLIMTPESSFYYGDERSTKPGRKYSGSDGTWGVHPGIMGFTLTFQAYSLLELKEAIEPSVAAAWADGIKLVAGRFDKSRNTGPGNMLLSGAVAFYYAYLATEDPFFAALYDRWEKRMVTGEMLSPAGVYYDGFRRAPDASYEGIALHRIAELYSINPSESVRDVLVKSYKLKRHFTLPEPDGEVISPSHFNDRSASGFARDQYGGREMMIAAEVPGVAPYLRMQEKKRSVDPSSVAQAMVRASTTPNHASPDPYPWGAGEGAHRRMHDWEAVLLLPYVLYRDEQSVIDDVLANGPGYAMTDHDRYSEDFAGEFYAFRRPAYAALFYTGVANESDSGATNYRGSVKGDGGYFNGFAGGGLSAFWVPEVGTGLIGRMNATEGYERSTKHRRFIPGWMDWANNHIIGELASGKVLTSARTNRPDSQIGTGGDGVERLRIEGEFLGKLRRQGNVMSTPGRYIRMYGFKETHVEVDVAVKFWGPTVFKSLYETIPMYLPEGVNLQYLDAQGRVLEAAAGERLTGVKYVVLQRAGGGTAIDFQNEVIIDLISESFVSKQQGPAVRVQALQVFFPKGHYRSRETAGISYSLVPFQGEWSLDLMPSSMTRQPELLFTQEVVRENLLQATNDLGADVWKRKHQVKEQLPVVQGNVVTFDVSGGDRYSARLSQTQTVIPGQKYIFWMRAKSDVPTQLTMCNMTGINKGRADETFYVGPEGYTEAWVTMTAVEADATLEVRLSGGKDLDESGLSPRATVTFDKLCLEAIDADTKFPQSSR